MARALTPLRSTTARARLLALALPCTLACNSDDPSQFTTEIDLTTTGATTQVNVFTTGEPEPDPTTTGEPDGPESCRDAVQCLFQCVTALPNPPPPEQDFGCFLDCQEGLNTEEVLGFIRLFQCVGDACFAKGECSNGPDNDSQVCQNCIVLGVTTVQPPVMGCEAQVMTCR
jgi:hypothetical protein